MNKNHFFASALCGGAFALAFFASCTDKDLYDPVRAQAIRQAQYEAQFKAAFGDIDPNQDWGFGTATPAKVAATRATRASYSFSGDDESVYKTEMPADLPPVADYAATWTGSASVPNASAYRVTEGTTVVNCHVGQCAIYIPAGTYSISEWHTRENTQVYLMPGAHVTFTNSLNENYTDNVWAIPADASITVEGDLSYNFKLYNRGTVKANNLALYANSFVYNAGTMDIKGNADVKNNGCEMVNAGTLTCAAMTVEGSGHVQNLGDVTVSGATTVNSNSASWVNAAGQFTTTDYYYYAGSDDVINCCKLNVTNLFKMVLGEGEGKSFKIDAEASVVANKFQMGIGRIDMKDKSILKVTNEAKMGITKLESYGIYGPSSGYAVFTAPAIKGGKVAVNSGEESDSETYPYMANYGGNLYVATDSHFADGNAGQYPYIYKTGNAEIVNGATSAPSIAPSQCSEGYEGGQVSVTVTHRYRVYAEDLGAEVSDWDFNDVVFDVIQYSNNSTDIILQAAGGTLLSELVFTGDNGQVSIDIHEKFGVATTTMVNTRVNAVSRPAVTYRYNTLIEPRDVEIYITYSGGERSAIPSETGKAAGKFCIDCTGIEWVNWMDEYVDIRTVYPNFGEWVNNAETIWWPQTPEEVEEEEKEDEVNPDDNGEYQTIEWQTAELYSNKYITFDNPKKPGTFIVTGQQENADGTSPIMLTWSDEWGLDWSSSQCTGTKELSDSFFMTVTYDYKNNITSDKIAFANMPSCTGLTIKFKPAN